MRLSVARVRNSIAHENRTLTITASRKCLVRIVVQSSSIGGAHHQVIYHPALFPASNPRPLFARSNIDWEIVTMTMRPDPTFYASPKLAMEAPPENFAYTLLLSPDFSKPDALAVIDVKRGSPSFSQIVHTVTMPNKGDE